MATARLFGPSWVDDDDVDNCELCATPFSFFVRKVRCFLLMFVVSRLGFWLMNNHHLSCLLYVYRVQHHCRACGHIFCSTCSAYELLLQIGPDPPAMLRACYTCFTSDAQRKTTKVTVEDTSLLGSLSTLPPHHSSDWSNLMDPRSPTTLMNDSLTQQLIKT